MKAIKSGRNLFALLLLASVPAAIWFALQNVPEAAFIFGAVSIASLVLLIRQIRRLYEARLVLDNRILAVKSAVISGPQGAKEPAAEETVVSTFGVLIGGKVYGWGYNGVRLDSFEIDKRSISLSFGSGAETLHMELLHSLTDREAVTQVQKKLWRETGVTAQVSGW